MDTTKNPAISIIMPSYLGHFPGAASNRKEKFIRAVESVMNQSTNELIELVVVSDGCAITNGAFDGLKAKSDWNNSHLRKMTLYPCLNVGTKFAGKLRNVGIETASGRIIAYLDTDDYLETNHIDFILKNFKEYSWVWFHDHVLNPDGTKRLRGAIYKEGHIGTSNIAHLRSCKATWGDGYGHDWPLIQDLTKRYPKCNCIGTGGYIVAHIPGQVDL